MNEKTYIEIMLICKGWYDENLYNNALDALNAYYHKHYGCENIIMDKKFALHLFLQPLALEAIKRKPGLAVYLFEPSYSMLIGNDSFIDIMYERTMSLIINIVRGTFNVSVCDEILNQTEQII